MRRNSSQYAPLLFNHALLLVGFMLAASVAIGGCLVDPDAPCGESQELNEDGFCVCVEGTVLAEDSSLCLPCGENEVEENGACVCDAGTSRDPSTGACVGTIAGLGQDCVPSADDCPAPLACQDLGGGDGYCTLKGCSDSTECVGGYACDTATTPSHCMRPPLGQGQSCNSDADCAGTEAVYCDRFSSRTCLVEGCNLASNDCFEGWLCCDFSMMGGSTYCIDAAECPF